MIILTKAIVSNSEMAKNYKGCREKAEILGKIFIFKNNQLDAVMFSVSEYERISKVIEYLDNLDESEMAEFVELLPNNENEENKFI